MLICNDCFFLNQVLTLVTMVSFNNTAFGEYWQHTEHLITTESVVTVKH